MIAELALARNLAVIMAIWLGRVEYFVGWVVSKCKLAVANLWFLTESCNPFNCEIV